MSWRWLLALSSGIVLAALLPALPDAAGLAILGVVALSLLIHSRTRVFAVFLLGALWFLVQAQAQLDQQWPASRSGEVVEMQFRVAALPEWQGESLRFIAEPLAGDGALPSRILVRWYLPGDYIQTGQVWSVKARLQSPVGRLNFRGFDYTRHLLSQRIGALATVREAERIDGVSQAPGRIDRGRQYLAEVLAVETRSRVASGLMRALAIADRGGIDAETRVLLTETGTAHLLAISGLHIGMIAMLAGAVAMVLVGPFLSLMPRFDRRRLSLAIALAAALAYALLAGLTLPTQRALIMLVIAAGAVLLRRGLLPGHALLLAFAGVLLFDPLAALATGFWMSFAAVAVLIWTFAWRPNQGSGFRAWLSGLLRAQLMIGLGLIALNAGVFNQVQWMGFPANLVAIPLVGFWILPSLLMSLVMIALDWPATAFLWLCEMGLEMLIDYLQWLQAISPATRVRPSISLAAMVLGVLGSLWLIGPPGWPARWLGLGLLVPVIWPALTPPLDSDELVLEMLDVGNGQAVLIQTRSELLLYDTGPGDGDGGDAIGRLLPAALADLERSRIDRLVVSSLHGGSRGGLASVIDQVPATQHFSAIGGQGVPCTSTIRWMSDAYHFSFLHPSPGLPDLGPNSSCVLMIEGPGGKILLTGRIDAGVERRLLVENSVLDVDVLVLADGGHRRAGSMSFIEALRPHLALASNERHDRWGRPHPELLDRLEAQDVALLSTGRCGALALRLQDGQPPSIVSALGRSSRFWHPEGDCP